MTTVRLQADARSERAMSTQPLFLGIIGGQQRRDHPQSLIAPTASPAACSSLRQAGRQRLHPHAQRHRLHRGGYAAMRLGAYAVPINWHFKPEEINYVLWDSAHRSDQPCRRCIPCAMRFLRVTMLSVDAAGNSRQLQDRSRSPRHAGFAAGLNLAETAGARWPGAARTEQSTPQAPQAIPRACGATRQRRAAASVERMRGMIYGLRPNIRAAAGRSLTPRRIRSARSAVSATRWC